MAPTGQSGPVSTPGVVELGGDKRVTVSDFKGKLNVDMREWYRNKVIDCTNE